MWESRLKLDKYLYARTNPYLIRTYGLIGLIATLLMGYGYVNFFGASPLFMLIFGPIAAIFIVNKVMRYFIQSFYPKFDITKHEKFVSDFWTNNPEPAVDVFLPWAGEDLDMHEVVLQAVANLDYKNYQVYMLDDKGSEEHRLLAEKYGFNYLSRPNKGEHKKSGNLEYGYRHSKGDFILILDADFVPTKDSLKDLVPYIASDNKIGILQTPQYLEQGEHVHERSRIEFGGGNIVEDFYKINMPCRDVFRAAMCVGTSAIYRRSAIMALNGTPKVHASEDLATGFLVTQHGYYVKYLPLICSMGKSPETFQGYFKQHHRWCSGNLVFARYWPTARLNLVARLVYISNPTYYLSEAFSVIFSFHFLALLFFHSNDLSLANSLYFLPYIIFSRFLVPLIKSHKSKLGTKLAAMSNSYTYIYTYYHMLVHGVPKWHPTGVKTSKLHSDFVNSINVGIIISAAFIVSFIFVLIAKPDVVGDYNNYLILGWSLYSAFWHVVFLYMASKYILSHKVTEVESKPAKAYHYAKAHLLPSLALVLGAALIVKTPGAIADPHSKTNIVIASVADRIQPGSSKAEQTDLAQVSSTPVPMVNLEVVEEVAAASDEVKMYAYTVKDGDSPIKLAERAIRDYLLVYDLYLDERQVDYAAATVVKRSEIKEKAIILPGDEMTFDSEVIKQTVEEAQGK